VTDDNFSCHSYSLQKLICSWNPQPNFVKSDYKLYVAADEIFIYNKGMYNCPEQLNEHSCQWTTKSEPIYRITAERFLFKLVSNNTLGTVTNYFNKSHYDIIEPSSPQQFKQTRLNATFVRLEWKPPEHFDYDFKLLQKLRYQLQIERRSSQKHVNFPSERLVFDVLGNYSFDFNRLIPFSEYRFSLRCHVSTNSQSRFWSRPANLTFQTPADIPYHCPAFYNSSFESSTTVTGDRSITVYWKPVDPNYSNAPNLKYRIEYGQVESLLDVRLTNKLAPVKISNSSVTFHTFEQMLTNVSYMFRIRSVNDRGLSECSSQLFIDKLINQPSKPMDLTVSYLGDGKYELKWKHSRPSQVKQFNVYWCPNVLPRPFPCLGVLNSKSVLNRDLSENANHNFSYLLENLDDKLNYQFSIAAESPTSSSGISWASCIIPKQIEKLDKINDFRAVAISPYAIEISWKLQCSAMSELIEKFEIAYCDVLDNDMNKCESHHKLVVDGGDQERAKLKSLQPNTLYRVSIRALIGAKASEENSAIVRTFDGPPAQPSHLIHQQSSSRSVTLHWALTVKPKESINFFEIMYGETVTVFDSQKVCTQTVTKSEAGSTATVKTSYECSATLVKNVQPSTLYQMHLKGCIMNTFMEIQRPVCSPATNITVRTDVEAPGVTRKAYVKVLDKSHVLIEWPVPEQPNGDIDHYKVRLFYRKGIHREWPVKGNVTQVEIDCSQHTQTVTKDGTNDSSVNYPFVSVAAVNVKNQTLLIGPFSEHSSVNLCEQISPEMSLTTLVSLTVLGAICILISAFVLFILCKWIWKQINYIKKMSIDLPTGLKEPRLNFDDSNPSSVSDPNAPDNKQSVLHLNRWNSLYLINADPSPSSVFKHDSPEDVFGDLTRLLLRTADRQHFEQQTIDQIDLKACVTSEYELQGIRGSSHISGSTDSSLDNNLDEQRPFLIGHRENDINSSGSNDSGVDVQTSNGVFGKAKSGILEPIHEKQGFYGDHSAFNTDLLVFQSMSSSVPSVYDASLKSNDSIKSKPFQHYTNLFKEMSAKPCPSLSFVKMNEMKSRMEHSSSDIDLSALQISNDLIDFQNLTQTVGSRNELLNQPEVHLNLKSHSLSLLDLRDMKSEPVNCDEANVRTCGSSSTESLDSLPIRPLDEIDLKHDINHLPITDRDYVAFASNLFQSPSVSLSNSMAEELSTEIGFDGQFQTEYDEVDDTKNDLDSSPKSSIETCLTIVQVDEHLFDIGCSADCAPIDSTFDHLDSNQDLPRVSLESLPCESLSIDSQPTFKSNALKSDYVPIYDLTKYPPTD
jgi:hypothetical protein